MGVSSTEASLRAVREDLDLPAAGSMSDRAVLNKVCKQSGPVSLAEYKGNILGTQLYIPGGTQPLEQSQWPKRRDESFATYYIARNGYVRLSGDRIQIEQQDISGNNGDYGTEARICGKVLEDGRYRLTGTAYAQFAASPGNGIHAQLHVQLIATTNDYLSGLQSLLVNDVYYRGGGTTFNINKFVTLSTSKPYIALIFRYIMSGQGATTNRYTHEFTNFKLVKE